MSILLVFAGVLAVLGLIGLVAAGILMAIRRILDWRHRRTPAGIQEAREIQRLVRSQRPTDDE